MDFNESCNTSSLINDRDSLSFNLRHFGFPILFILGLIGNILNLLFLGSTCNRTQRNTASKAVVLLSCLAFSDLLFLLVRAPVSIATYHIADRSQSFRIFYYSTKIPFLFLANWFSGASIWFAVAVAAQQAIQVCRPIRSPGHPSETRTRLSVVIGLILGGTLLFNLYHRFLHSYTLCPAPFPSKAHFHENPGISSCSLLGIYMKLAVPMGPLIMLILPVLTLIGLNLFLVFRLRRSVESWESRTALVFCQRRVTRIVCAVICPFILLYIPGTFVVATRIFMDFNHQSYPPWHPQAAAVGNFLIEVSKTVNFLLYCASSKRFRQTIAYSLTLLCFKLFGSVCCNEKKTSKDFYLEMRSTGNEEEGPHH